jgi:hypothetical protein
MTSTVYHLSARTLATRIWHAFPVTEPAFAKLLGLLDIEVSDAIPTAAVTLGLNSRLCINPEFAERHCQQDEALVMLVLHELWHVALGHTRLHQWLTPAQNWAFDAVINSQLCRLYPDAAHTRLFRDLYEPNQFPNALLRPPEGWRTAAEKWLPGRAGEVHRLLYSDSSASTDELLRLLPLLYEEDAIDPELLGSHPPEENAGAAPDVLREIRDIVAEWPIVKKRSGRDRGGDLVTRNIVLQRASEETVRLLRQSLMRLAGLTTGSGRLWRGDGEMESILPYGRDRRAGLRALWHDSVPIHRSLLTNPTLCRHDRVHVYLDVSGSMAGVIRPLYAALASLSPWIAPQVQLFSTNIKGISIAQLRQGKLVTTDGTHIQCVTAHLLQMKVQRALIVTDGWVGDIPGEHLAALRSHRVDIEAAVTSGGDTAFMHPLGNRFCQLPKL